MRSIERWLAVNDLVYLVTKHFPMSFVCSVLHLGIWRSEVYCSVEVV